MIDKKELISTYLQQFGSHYQISRLLNPTLRIDDEFISHFFEQVVDQYGETFAITEEEKTEIERKIKSQYCIFQDEGAALVGDYEHDFMWYANLQAQEDYWELQLLTRCVILKPRLIESHFMAAYLKHLICIVLFLLFRKT